MTTVRLRGSSSGFDSRDLSATLHDDGHVTIRGQDVGGGVGRGWGSGSSEYEWAWSIQERDVPQLVLALDAGDDVLAALAARFSDDAGANLGRFLKEHDIPAEFWSRVGD